MSHYVRIALVDPRLRHPYDRTHFSLAKLAYLPEVLSRSSADCRIVRLADYGSIPMLAESGTINDVDAVWLYTFPGTQATCSDLVHTLRRIATKTKICLVGPMSEYEGTFSFDPADVDMVMSGDPEAFVAPGGIPVNYEPLRLQMYMASLDGLPHPRPELQMASVLFTRDRIGRHHRRVAEIWSSRGCPGACSFCVTGNSGRRPRWLGMSPEKVAAEARTLCEQYGAEHIHFVDDSFLADVGRGLAILEYLCDLGLTSSFAARSTDLRKTDPLLLQRLGCRQIEVGVEHTCRPVLRRYAKPKAQLEHLRMFIAAGIDLQLDLIPFDPWTSLEELTHLVVGFNEAGLIECVSSSIVHRLDIIPGTRIHGKFLREVGVSGKQKYFLAADVNDLYSHLLKLAPTDLQLSEWRSCLYSLRSPTSLTYRAILGRISFDILSSLVGLSDMDPVMKTLEEVRYFCSGIN
ncbi:MAG: B12-binding domain-containing radical SAM protein [Bacillota bacterium]